MSELISDFRDMKDSGERLVKQVETFLKQNADQRTELLIYIKETAELINKMISQAHDRNDEIKRLKEYIKHLEEEKAAREE